MKAKQFLCHVIVTAALLWAGVANAMPYNFTIAGDYSAHWQLDSNLTPNYESPGDGFVLTNVPGFPDAAVGVADLMFYNQYSPDGLSLLIQDRYGDKTLFIAYGPQLYTGIESAPEFKLGTFRLTQFSGPGTYTLTISAVPEPETYGMLLAGLGLIGAVARRKRA